MSSWEHDANAALRALGDSYQQGGISRATYRERRRRVLAAMRERLDVTERKPIHAGRRDAPAFDRANLHGEPVPRRWLALLIAVAVGVAIAGAAAAHWILKMKTELGDV
ncbi:MULTISPECIES: hypothetical protein [unclassified Luteimonas]